MKVFIAAGHGASDPGAVANGTNEATEVINIVDKAVDILLKTPIPGVEIVKIDDKLNLTDEVAVINRDTTEPNTDLCIEIHMNSNQGIPGSGVECYWGNKDLATKLGTTYAKEVGLPLRKIAEWNALYFNNMTTPGSALLELGFINNQSDLAIVREKAAEALATAVLSVLPAVKPTTPQPPLDAKVGMVWVIKNFPRIVIYLYAHPGVKETIEQIP